MLNVILGKIKQKAYIFRHCYKCEKFVIKKKIVCKNKKKIKN